MAGRTERRHLPRPPQLLVLQLKRWKNDVDDTTRSSDKTQLRRAQPAPAWTRKGMPVEQEELKKSC